ncbi:MAG: class I SAM-dependent rRNA methyltransferase, partial [Anaerolineales bacterium]|nr:class I SAM-dependent rRNA methyltransferase [Anaerolineales bacterium]
MTSWQARIDAAWARRAPLRASADTSAYRLINDAGDGFPGLTVDRYAGALVASLHEQARDAPPERLLRALAERAGAATAYVKRRPRQARVLDEAARRAAA